MNKKPTYGELKNRIQKLEQAESDRKHRERQFIHSHDLMDYIISHARSAIAVFDRDLKYIYVSTRYLNDYKVKEQHIIGKHHYEVFPDLPQRWRDVHQRSLAGEVLSAEEDPYYREDGSVHWTRWECRPWYESDGSIGGIIIYNEIINEWKKIEETLRKSEQMLSTHLLNTPIGAISWDSNFRTVEWNPAAESIFGYSKAEAMGKHVTELIVPEEVKEMVEGLFQDILSGKGGARSINENITRDGRRIICDWYNTALTDADGESMGMASLVNDITERLQTEKALQESENRFRDISLSMEDWIWETDRESKFTYISQSIKDVLGYAPEELIGKTPFDLMPEDESVRVKEIVLKIFSKFENIRDMENWNIDKAGNRLFMLTNGIPILDNEGKIQGYRGVNKNITAQRKLETQLQQAQKMESIGTLAGGIAHDFNNILFPILGHTEMLLEDVTEDSPSRNSLKEIYTAALRAKDLINQILTFSHQESNELKLIKMQPIIKEALKLIRSTIPTTIDIKQDINPDCGVIKADPTQIHQIVMNLSTNAYHAMEDTGGELHVSLKEVDFGKLDPINPHMEPGIYGCLKVSDTGTGMNKTVMDKIFDPFFTTKAIGRGTGMGLSVVHGIVTSMGGVIQVNSRPGKGTEFHVYFPIEKSSFKEQITGSTAIIQGGTEQILLVDDEEAILTMEKQILERLGYHVTSRASSIEALEAFRNSPDKFDLVITDMAMPNMSGDKLSMELTKIRPDIPIVLCTGFSDIMSEEKAASLGITGFLLKPIVMSDLDKKIRDVLDEN